MKIRIGYDIEFNVPAPVPAVLMLYTHPSRAAALANPDFLRIEPAIPIHTFTDCFGNRCARIKAPAGRLRIWSDNVITDSGVPDPVDWNARQHPIEEVPDEFVQYLLASRYCEVDLLSDIAWKLFGNIPPGWPRVQAICDWVQSHVTFSYPHARRTRTALELYKERIGVCRDFQHLAITFCRAMNIPARYATGYLGDIGIPSNPDPMDFSAWFEVYLSDRWWPLDARHNRPRIGRILMAVGRDAADAALTTSFGAAPLTKFVVWTDEIEQEEMKFDSLRACMIGRRSEELLPR